MLDTMTAVTSSSNRYTLGQVITLVAKVGTNSGETVNPSGLVTFLDGTTSLGNADFTSRQTTLNISSLSVGSHSITAKYNSGNNFKPSTSSILTLKILNQSDLEPRPIHIENPVLDTITAVTSSANEYTSG